VLVSRKRTHASGQVSRGRTPDPAVVGSATPGNDKKEGVPVSSTGELIRIVRSGANGGNSAAGRIAGVGNCAGERVTALDDLAPLIPLIRFARSSGQRMTSTGQGRSRIGAARRIAALASTGAGHTPARTGHCVWTTGQRVSDAGQRVSAAGHCVSTSGHLV